MASVSVNSPKTPVTKGSNGIAAATLPNVCKMPGPPAPFVPTPLPNIGKSGDSPKGYSKKVKIEGYPVAITGATFGSMGDMASKGTGGGIVSNNTHGPTSFIAPGSLNVKIEGKNVQLLGDQMLNNGGPSGSPTNSATMSGTNQPSCNVDAATQKLIDEGKCPCCKKSLHPNQVDENGKAYPLLKGGEDEFYDKGVATMQSKLSSIAADVDAGVPYTKDEKALESVKTKVAAQVEAAVKSRKILSKARQIEPPCENLHEKNKECGAHFDTTRSLRSLAPVSIVDSKKKHTYVRETVLGFDEAIKDACRELWRKKGKKIGKSSPVCHKTPLAAGGCPTDQNNLVPRDALSEACKEVDDAQTKLQEIGERKW